MVGVAPAGETSDFEFFRGWWSKIFCTLKCWEEKHPAFLHQCQERAPKRELWGVAGGFGGVSASMQKRMLAQRNIIENLHRKRVVLGWH